MEMQQRLYSEINSHQKSATYTAGNHFHHPNKNVDKNNTLTIPFNNLLNRGNYHYNYTPTGSTQKLLEKNKHSADSFQLKEKQEGQSNNQSLKFTQNDNDRSYIKYAVSESKHSVQNSKNKNCNFTQNLFPNTFKVMDLSKFIEQNVLLRKRLINELNDIRQRKNNKYHLKNKLSNNQLQQSKTPQKSLNPSRQKLSTYDDQHPGQSIEQQQQQQQLQQLRLIKQQKQQQIQQQKHQLTELKKKNTLKRQQIQKLQEQMLNHSIHETPLLREKQQAIEYLSVQIEWLNEKTMQLKRLTNSKFAEKNIFEMYEQMCRQCETLRKDNNKKSEKLKSLFEKSNKLTGKQENVNMFLMNLKV